MVPEVGFEPTSAEADCPLKTACIPVSPLWPSSRLFGAIIHHCYLLTAPEIVIIF